MKCDPNKSRVFEKQLERPDIKEVAFLIAMISCICLSFLRWRRRRRIIMSTFFTYEERLTLQKYLKESRSFKQIAKSLGKDPSTISREVRKHMLEVTAVKAGKVPNSKWIKGVVLKGTMRISTDSWQTIRITILFRWIRLLVHRAVNAF